MAEYSNLRGTNQLLLALGLGGLQLKNEGPGAALAARLSDDSNYAIMRGATAVSANDLIPLGEFPSLVASELWTTLLDLDFTSLPNQTINADGNVTINGLTWVKGNSANEVVSSTIVNGTGLVFTPSSTSDNGNLVTMPNLWLGVTQILTTTQKAAFGWLSRLRIYISIGADNEAANFDFFNFALCAQPTVGSGILIGTGYDRGHNSTNGQCGELMWSNNARVVNTSPGPTLTKTLLAEFSQLVPPLFWLGDSANLAAGAPFPAPNTFTPVASSGANSVAAVANQGVNVNPLQMGVMVGAMRSGSATAYVTTLQRLRVEWSP